LIDLQLFWFQASQDKKSLDVGANLFIGNLDPVSHLIMHMLNRLMPYALSSGLNLSAPNVAAGCRWEALVRYFQCIWSYCY